MVRRNFEVHCCEVHAYMLAGNVTVFFNIIVFYCIRVVVIIPVNHCMIITVVIT